MWGQIRSHVFPFASFQWHFIDCVHHCSVLLICVRRNARNHFLEKIQNLKITNRLHSLTRKEFRTYSSSRADLWHENFPNLKIKSQWDLMKNGSKQFKRWGFTFVDKTHFWLQHWTLSSQLQRKYRTRGRMAFRR